MINFRGAIFSCLMENINDFWGSATWGCPRNSPFILYTNDIHTNGKA